MADLYSLEKKKKLADRIHLLNNKEHFKMIKNIIINNNPSLEFIKNSNGLFTQFQSLSNITYQELEKFLNKIDRNKIVKLINSSSPPDTHLTENNIDKPNRRKQEYAKKLRLTNTETHLLNRAKYENELKKNETSEDNVVSDKDNDKEQNKNKEQDKNKKNVFQKKNNL
jgi:hypothetical protein